MPPLAPCRRAIASHASCSTGLSPAGGVRFSGCAAGDWRALNPTISRPPTRWWLAEISMRADFGELICFGGAKDSDTAGPRCALWRAIPVPADFCWICLRGGAAANVTNAAESEISVTGIVILSARARVELFCFVFI